MIPRFYYRWYGVMLLVLAAVYMVMTVFVREARDVYGMQPFIVAGIGVILIWLADYGSGQKEDERK